MGWKVTTAGRKKAVEKFTDAGESDCLEIS